MTLPGYAIDTYAQLTQIDVTNYKDKTNFFVVDKQSWYYLDKTDNNTWKPCIDTKLSSLVNLTSNYVTQYPSATQVSGLITYFDQSHIGGNGPVFQLQDKIAVNQLPLQTIERLDQVDDYIATLFSTGTNLANTLNNTVSRVTNLETAAGGEVIIKKVNNTIETPTIFPKLEILIHSNPNRTLFGISGFNALVYIGGSVIQNSSNPIAQGFNADFIGQQWLDTTNNDLWIATGAIDSTYYGWRKVILEPRVSSNNISGGGGSR